MRVFLSSDVSKVLQVSVSCAESRLKTVSSSKVEEGGCASILLVGHPV